MSASIRAAALVGYVHAVAPMVQHLNTPTPRWLSVVFQRPEAHGLHHERNIHHRNFGDLPLWDMIFGTLRQPGAVRRRGRLRGIGVPADRGDARLRRRAWSQDMTVGTDALRADRDRRLAGLLRGGTSRFRPGSRAGDDRTGRPLLATCRRIDHYQFNRLIGGGLGGDEGNSLDTAAACFREAGLANAYLQIAPGARAAALEQRAHRLEAETDRARLGQDSRVGRAGADTGHGPYRRGGDARDGDEFRRRRRRRLRDAARSRALARRPRRPS